MKSQVVSFYFTAIPEHRTLFFVLTGKVAE